MITSGDNSGIKTIRNQWIFAAYFLRLWENSLIAIIGGGISGLWALAQLRGKGYPAVLIEKSGLGGRQTLASQGIIHGGTKYALTGQLSGAAQAIAQMPVRWQQALSGQGGVNLAGAAVFSKHQYLWTTHAPGGKITSFFASKLMRSRMQKLSRAALPDFLPSSFNGHCYALDEPVVDVVSVITCLIRQYGNAIFTDCEWNYDGETLMIHRESGEVISLRPERIIYSAGEANQALSGEVQQRRPLKMMALRVPQEAPAIYGHCLGMSDKPKITVTTHPFSHGEPGEDKVYWIGGQPAEQGVSQTDEEFRLAIRTVLAETLPWLPQSWLEKEANFLPVVIDRAEGLADGKRPDQPVIVENGKAITVWPTKLAFAPLVAERLEALLPDPTGEQPQFPRHAVRIAPYLWENVRSS